MKKTLLVFALTILFFSCKETTETTSEVINSDIITSDIDNFWKAYDVITALLPTDSAAQHSALHELFLSKGTPGLTAIMQARRYTPQSYIDAINNHPKFWKSIRPNTLKAKSLSSKMNEGVARFREIYPHLKPAKIYFSMGAFRTPGTTMDNMVLIGSELAMADKNTDASEFSERMGHLPGYFKTNPIENIVFLNVHEFVHTQQITTIGDNLMTQCLYEGVAEFVAEKAMNLPSSTPAIAFGKANDEAIKKAFAEEMFHYSYQNWLWNDTSNQFKMRDLGYYVGYAIADKYYHANTNKNKAIKDLIEVNYGDNNDVAKFIEKTGYFNKSVVATKIEFDSKRPQVTDIQPFKNGAKDVDSSIQKITLTFSEPMNTQSRGFEFGPLGEEAVLRVQNVLGFSDDGKSFSFEVKMESNKKYQLVASPRFRNVEGVPMKAFLIEVETGG